MLKGGGDRMFMGCGGGIRGFIDVCFRLGFFIGGIFLLLWNGMRLSFGLKGGIFRSSGFRGGGGRRFEFGLGDFGKFSFL